MTDQGFPLSRDEAVATARRLVTGRFPDARCAWLAGSVVAGTATSTSDLDIVVLLDGPPAPFRESLVHEDIPVELFVHTLGSIAHYRAKDRSRRQPTMARLIAGGVVLVDRDNVAADLATACLDEVLAGPDPLPQHEIDAARYHVTDLLADLEGAVDETERAVLVAALWEQAARLLLGHDQQWQGSGKGLLRALQARDRALGDDRGARLTEGLTAGPAALDDAVRGVLEHCGGALFAGYRVGGVSGPSSSA